MTNEKKAKQAWHQSPDAGEMISKDDLLFELNYLYVELNELYDKEACQREGRVTCKASKLLTPNERRQRSQGYKSGLLTAIHLIKNRFNQWNNDEQRTDNTTA